MGEVVLVEDKKLSDAEKSKREELEKIIQENFLGFVAVGRALAEIREARLYRTTHSSFEGYCRDLWDMSKQRADQLEKSAVVIENLTKNVNNCCRFDTQIPEIIIPQNEAQARELAQLEPEDQCLVWGELVQRRLDRSNGNDVPKITAKAVKNAVKAYRGEKIERAVERSRKEIRQNRTNFQSEAFEKAWEALWDQVNIEHKQNWRHTSREVVYRHLGILMELVAGAGTKELKKTALAQVEAGER